MRQADRIWTRVVRGAGLASVSRLVVPVWCPGCGRPDQTICVRCAAPMMQPGRFARQIVGSSPPWWRGLSPPIGAVCSYSGPVRRVMVAWKDRGRRDLDPLVAHAMLTSCRHALAAARDDVGPSRLIALVPVPSTARASRRRSGRVVEQALAGVMPALPGRTVLHPAVTMGRGGRDQVGLSAHARRDNVRERLRLRFSPPAGALIILVDDVVTTGASLAETARVLPKANPVVGAAVIAVTPPPGAGPGAQRRIIGSGV